MALWGLIRRNGGRRRPAAVVCGLGLALCTGTAALDLRAQPTHPATMGASAPSRPAATEGGVGWRELSAQQKDDLRPLEHDWATIDPLQKRKWLELTGRMPKMSADERSRILARMNDWAKLTPEQRGQARLRYQEAKQVPLRDRQARWNAYQSLSTEQKQRLAERASLAASAALAARRAASLRERPPHDLVQPKSNIVANSEFATAPRSVAPALVQARPGATTTSIARAASPPLHQQLGMPKIAATPEFVNKSTLLPRHGPQAAAVRSTVPASAAAATVKP